MGECVKLFVTPCSAPVAHSFAAAIAGPFERSARATSAPDTNDKTTTAPSVLVAAMTNKIGAVAANAVVRAGIIHLGVPGGIRLWPLPDFSGIIIGHLVFSANKSLVTQSKADDPTIEVTSRRSICHLQRMHKHSIFREGQLTR